MKSGFCLSSISTLCLAFIPCSAFLRTAPDINPYEYDYVKYGPVPTPSDIIAFNTSGIKSYWWATFLYGSNNHSYSVVITSGNSGTSNTISSASITDITAGTHYGTSITEPGQASTSKFSVESSVLQVGSTAPDQFSQTWAIGNFPELAFDLQFVPKGPNLYQGGAGSFLWGDGYAYAIDAPETLVTGTFQFEGENVTVIPGESMGWFDLQWGPGYAVGGWYDFVILLENGIKIQITITHLYPSYSQGSFANILYPDGHMELYPVNNDTKPTNSWVSPQSDITYYHNYIVDIPLKNSILYVELPVKGGETGPVEGVTAANTIADTFAWYNGTWDGLAVKGWGIMELRNNAECASFGAC